MATPSPSDGVEHLLVTALDHDPADRDAFLVTACGDNLALLGEVRALLAAHDAAPTGFLNEVASLDPDDLGATVIASPGTVPLQHLLPSTESPGDQIGLYKLREQIGEGGFGTVWVADQDKPVRRRVALKVIKLGMDTEEVVARFEQERQALAVMDHPNIAKVLDAGATDKGRPFFVMELVRGVKITDYCDEHQLSTEERIQLFIIVCQAVQHAHQKGIIHRDLKPSNILVTVNDGKPVPKVIDFGVAKATQGRLTENTIYTQFQQMVGTPLYMSPEQADMTSLDVDTRSDIYSLGVLLYELLTGRTPIDEATMRKAGLDEMRRMIRELDPPRPSMRFKTLSNEDLTTVAKRHHTDPARLPGALSGDVDWIVMKCLEKDRQRRYDTANGLALDLQRHLQNEVITARPPTAAYLLGKLFRRNELAFVAGAAIAASLVIGTGVSVWQAVRANRALDELRASAPAFVEQARGLAAREQYQEAIAKLDYAIRLRPDAAEHLVAKADLLQCQLKLAEATAIYREALRVKPGLARAEDSAKLCDELLAAQPAAGGKLTRESLAKLHLAMQKQQRPAAELMPVARLLGEEKKLLVEYWLARFKDLPVSAENPLAKRLTVREDGRLALDLSDTKVTDLSPLAAAPLAVLDVSWTKGQSELTDLASLRGLDLIELNISNTSVAILAPLSGMLTLEKLTMSGSKVTDLSALSALRLKSLNFYGCAISDLTPIRKMALEEINVRESRVADISPLIGMPIKSLDLTGTPVLDFSPLAQLPLERCYLQSNRITDLAVLRGLPLKELVLNQCVDARNYAVLTEIKTLELLLLPSSYRSLPAKDYEAIGALRDHPKLRQLGANYMAGMPFAATSSKDAFWQEWDREQTFIPALRKTGLRFTFWQQPDGTYGIDMENQPISDLTLFKGAPISYFELNGCKVRDLSPLRDSPLHYLNLGLNPVTDLSPLRDTPIKDLWLWRTPVTDLSPLRGLKLDGLVLHTTQVSDLSPLAGMPLKRLDLAGCKNVTDVSPVLAIPTLEKLLIPRGARNIGLLRKLPNLKRLSYELDGRTFDNRTLSYAADTTVADFWREYEANPWIARLTDAGISYSAAEITEATPAGTRRTGTLTVRIESKDFSDCSIFRGADSVRELNLAGTAVTTLQPLRGLKLTTLILPPNARDIEFLRASNQLQRISFKEDPKTRQPAQTAAEFWKDYDSQGWLRALQASDVTIKSSKQHPDGTWDLDLADTAITDLTILKGAPISVLSLGRTAVTDLEPLRGMPLTKLTLWYTPVADLRPLEGMPLRTLHLQATKVKDLSVLRGMPLTSLRLHDCPELTDLSPLQELKELTELTLPPQAKNLEFLRTFPKLERLGFKQKLSYSPDKTAAEFWKEYDAQGWLRALRATGLAIKSAKQLEDGTWDVDLANTTMSDLTLLRGAGISALGLNTTAVTDLTPLRDLPLTKLNIANTTVTDLSPLKGLPLAHLVLRGTKVTDLSALRGMSLTELYLCYCQQLTDLSPLADCRELRAITLPPKPADIEFLRKLPKLERISFQETPNDYARPKQTTAEFWAEYDAKKK